MIPWALGCFTHNTNERGRLSKILCKKMHPNYFTDDHPASSFTMLMLVLPVNPISCLRTSRS